MSWGTVDATRYKFDTGISLSSIPWEHRREFPAPTALGITAWRLRQKASQAHGDGVFSRGFFLRFPPRYDYGLFIFEEANPTYALRPFFAAA